MSMRRLTAKAAKNLVAETKALQQRAAAAKVEFQLSEFDAEDRLEFGKMGFVDRIIFKVFRERICLFFKRLLVKADDRKITSHQQTKALIRSLDARLYTEHK
jgi:hypothetical protein